MRFDRLRYSAAFNDSLVRTDFKRFASPMLVSSLALAAACSADPGVPGDAGPQLPPGVVGVRTTAPDSVFSGREVPVRCELVDIDGEVVAWARIGVASVAVSDSDVVATMDDGTFRAGAVGTATVACAVANLVDDTPETVEVKPGAPATVLTIVSRATVQADPDDVGTDVTCEVRDAAGNLLSNEDSTIELGNPFAGELTDANAFFTLASTQQVGCIVPGAVTTWADVLVQPGRPAQIFLDLAPPQASYNPGDTVTAATVVVDSYGNVADSSNLVVDSNPAATTHVAGSLAFTYATPGNFAIVAHIDTGTVTGAPIVATRPVLISDGGPSISCTPQMYRVGGASGNTWSALQISGSVTNMVGFSYVRVDRNGDRDTTDAGEDFTPASGQPGNFSTTVDPDFGANCYLVEAMDTQNNLKQRCCPFIASELYAAEIPTPTVQNPGPGSISFALPQRGIDDRAQNAERVGLAQSIADVIDRGITAASLSTYVHNYFKRPGNPTAGSGSSTGYYVGSGVAHLCFIFCIDIPVDAYYRPDIQLVAIDQPDIDVDLFTQTTSPAHSGLRTPLFLKQFRLGLEIRIPGAPSWVNTLVAGATEGNTYIDNLSGNADWTISAANGKFKTDLYPNSFVVSYADSDLHSGNVLVSLAAAIFPSVIRNTLTQIVAQVIQPLVQDLLGSVTIDTFGLNIPLPKLDGTGSLNVRVSGSFTSASCNAQALSAVIAPYFIVTGGTPQGLASLGPASQTTTIVPLELRGTGLLNQSLGLSLHDETVNDLVHRLWRASYFQGPLNITALSQPPPVGLGIDFGPLSSIASVFNLSMSAALPPVAEIRADGLLRVSLAGLRVALTIPGASDPTPLELEVTAVFDVATTIANVATSGPADYRIQVLSVTPVGALDLRVMTAPAGLSTAQLNTMVSVSNTLVSSLMTDVLSRSLVAIPVPRLAFPQVLGPVMLPNALTLAITTPVLTKYGTYPNRHLVISGGIQEIP